MLVPSHRYLHWFGIAVFAGVGDGLTRRPEQGGPGSFGDRTVLADLERDIDGGLATHVGGKPGQQAVQILRGVDDAKLKHAQLRAQSLVDPANEVGRLLQLNRYRAGRFQLGLAALDPVEHTVERLTDVIVQRSDDPGALLLLRSG